MKNVWIYAGGRCCALVLAGTGFLVTQSSAVPPLKYARPGGGVLAPADAGGGAAADRAPGEIRQERRVMRLGGGPGEPGPGGPRGQREVIVRSIERDGDRERIEGPAGAWMGVTAVEAPEALTAQLKLDPGVGLVVSFLAPKGPAAQAGLQKNDLLIELDGQKLVHPAQLRKLVQVRKEGDKVEVAYIREGKRETATVTLEKGRGFGPFEPGVSIAGDIPGMIGALMPDKQAFQDQMQHLKDAMSNLKSDQGRVKDELRRSLAEAQRAIEEALRQAGRARSAALDPAHRALRESAEAEAQADRYGSVTVRSKAKNVRSLVRSDDAGTVVIVADPKPHLTAHDKEGKLVFDGFIDSPEERKKVPAELWERVEPMLDEMKVGGRPEPEEK